MPDDPRPVAQPVLPPRHKLTLWVIYDRPRDLPQAKRYMLRPQFVVGDDGEILPSAEAWARDTIGELRDLLPDGVAYLGREPDDDAAIVEVWV